MKTRRISLWAGRQANLIPASFYKNLCGLCGNLFMSICQNSTSIGSASDTVNVPTSRPPSRSLKTWPYQQTSLSGAAIVKVTRWYVLSGLISSSLKTSLSSALTSIVPSKNCSLWPGVIGAVPIM